MDCSYKSLRSTSKEDLPEDDAELGSFIGEDGHNDKFQHGACSCNRKFSSAAVWLVILSIIFLNILANILVFLWRPRTYDIGFETDLSKSSSLLAPRRVRASSTTSIGKSDAVMVLKVDAF